MAVRQGGDTLATVLFVGDDEPATLVHDTTWSGNQPGCAAADLDGDGREDLAIADEGANRSAGRVAVYTAVPGSGALADAPVRLDGAEDSQLGTALIAGDTDDDGVADLVVGAPGHDADGLQDAGAVLVFRGPLTSRAAADADLRVHAEERWVGLGRSLAVVGAGGITWIAAGAGYVPPDSLHRYPHAQVYLFDGSANGDATTASAAAMFSAGLGDPRGVALAAGDLDGDGVPELVVGDSVATADARPDGTGVVWAVDLGLVLAGR